MGSSDSGYVNSQVHWHRCDVRIATSNRCDESLRGLDPEVSFLVEDGFERRKLPGLRYEIGRGYGWDRVCRGLDSRVYRGAGCDNECGRSRRPVRDRAAIGAVVWRDGQLGMGRTSQWLTGMSRTATGSHHMGLRMHARHVAVTLLSMPGTSHRQTSLGPGQQSQHRCQRRHSARLQTQFHQRTIVCNWLPNNL